jgi:hypothetical protein
MLRFRMLAVVKRLFFYLNTVFRYLLWSSNLVACRFLVLPVTIYHVGNYPLPPPIILHGLAM